MKKPILVFPYHDPEGKYEKIFLKNIETLKQIFGGICISSTYPTIRERDSFLQELEENGFFVYRNIENSSLGDHHRNALKLADEKFSGHEVYFGYLDRILFALETKIIDVFIGDISKQYSEDLVIFSRSDAAWKSHPKDYWDLENLVAIAGKVFFDLEVDWTWCGALIKSDLVNLILEKSKSQDMSILAEIILIGLANNKSIRNTSVDWLEWEDPFWDESKKQVCPIQKKKN